MEVESLSIWFRGRVLEGIESTLKVLGIRVVHLLLLLKYVKQIIEVQVSYLN